MSPGPHHDRSRLVASSSWGVVVPPPPCAHPSPGLSAAVDWSPPTGYSRFVATDNSTTLPRMSLYLADPLVQPRAVPSHPSFPAGQVGSRLNGQACPSALGYVKDLGMGRAHRGTDPPPSPWTTTHIHPSVSCCRISCGRWLDLSPSLSRCGRPTTTNTWPFPDAAQSNPAKASRYGNALAMHAGMRASLLKIILHATTVAFR